MNASQLARLAALPDPFGVDVVRSGHELLAVDVPSLHAEVEQRVLAAVVDASSRRAVLLLPVLGSPGEGKTHLLARLRRRLHAGLRQPAGPDALLAIIPPVRDAETPCLHVLREACASLSQPLGVDADRQDGPLARLLQDFTRRACGGSNDPRLRALAELPGPSTFLAAAQESFDTLRGPLLLRLDEALERDARLAPVLVAAIDPAPGSLRAATRWLQGGTVAEAERARLELPPPIDGEREAGEVLLGLARLGPALLLGLDQLEGAELRGADVLPALFQELAALYQEPAALVVLACCQTDVWPRLRETMPEYVRDRFASSEKLRPPTADEAVALAIGRLRPVHAGAGVQASDPLAPLDEPELRALVTGGHVSTPRHLLRALSSLWSTALRTPPRAPPSPRARAESLLARKRAELEAEQGVDPELRAARIGTALRRAGALLCGTSVNGTTILEAGPAQVSKRRKPGLGLSLDRAGARRRLYLELQNSTNGTSALSTIERCAEAVGVAGFDRAVVLRQEGLALPKAARARLADASHVFVVPIPADGAPSLVAIDRLLDAARDAELPDEISTAVAAAGAAADPLVGALLEAAFRDAAQPPPTDRAERARIAGRVLDHLDGKRSLASERQLSLLLGVEPAVIADVLDELVESGEVELARDRDDARVVLARPAPRTEG